LDRQVLVAQYYAGPFVAVMKRHSLDSSEKIDVEKLNAPAKDYNQESLAIQIYFPPALKV